MAYLSGAFPLHFLNQRDNSAVCGYGRAFDIFICVLCRRIRCPPDLSNLFLICTICTQPDDCRMAFHNNRTAQYAVQLA